MKQSKIKGKALFQEHGRDSPSSASRAPSDSESDADSTTMELDLEGAIDAADLFFPHSVSSAAENRRLLKRRYQVRYLIALPSVGIKMQAKL